MAGWMRGAGGSPGKRDGCAGSDSRDSCRGLLAGLIFDRQFSAKRFQPPRTDNRQLITSLPMHSPRRNRSLTACLMAVLVSAACRGQEAPGRVVVRRPSGEIEFTAIVNAKAFNDGWVMPGYHALVWKGGRMAHAALLQADVTDRQVLEALEGLGAKPGDNLPMAAWEERKNLRDPATDTVVAGPAVEVVLPPPGREGLGPLSSPPEDSAGRGLARRGERHEPLSARQPEQNLD